MIKYWLHVGEKVSPKNCSSIVGTVIKSQMARDCLLVSVEWANELGDKIIQTHPSYELTTARQEGSGLCQADT